MFFLVVPSLSPFTDTSSFVLLPVRYHERAEWRENTVWCHYIRVDFIPNPHDTHPTAHPWGRDMGCLLCLQTLIYVLLQFSSVKCNITTMNSTNIYILQILSAKCVNRTRHMPLPDGLGQVKTLGKWILVWLPSRLYIFWFQKFWKCRVEWYDMTS